MLKIEHLGTCLATMANVYAGCAIHVTTVGPVSVVRI